jgi:ABC-type transport system involved in multi-copper enzyme maturation permease subunit
VQLVWLEVVRLTTRVRFWVPVVLLAIAGILVARNVAHSNMVFGASDGYVEYGKYASAVILETLPILSFLPMVLPFVVSDSLPNDRNRRYSCLLMSRGISRSRLVLTRVMAGAVVSVPAVVVVLAAVVAAAILNTPVGHDGEVGSISGFLPEMLSSNPSAYFGLVALAYFLATVAVLAGGVLVGVLTKSWLASVLVPPIVILVSQFLPLPEALQSLNPGARATFTDYSATWAEPYTTSAYWLVTAGLLTIAATIIYARKEDL